MISSCGLKFSEILSKGSGISLSQIIFSNSKGTYLGHRIYNLLIDEKLCTSLVFGILYSVPNDDCASVSLVSNAIKGNNDVFSLFIVGLDTVHHIA